MNLHWDKKGIRESFLIVCWAFYDLANQFFALNVISVYFPRWLTSQKQAPAVLYSLAFGASMVIVAVLAPVLGTISDLQKKKKSYLTVLTLLSVVFTILLSRTEDLPVALFCFVVANIGCQLAIVFYNALLVRVAEARRLGFVSGVGRMFAYMGAILAMLLSKPLIARYGYSSTFLMTGVAFFIFALPALIFIREPRPSRAEPFISFLNAENLIPIWEKLKSVFRKSTEFAEIRRFLIAFFYGLCALQTVMLFMSVYAGEAFGLTETAIVDLVIFSTLFAVAGSILSGVISDRVGTKRAMVGVFVLWFVSFLAGAFLKAPFHWLIGALVGFALSSTWVVARAWVVRLVPEDNIGEIFGFFNLVAYVAGVVGPLYWGGMLLVLSPFGPWRYRLALLSLVVFIILAFYHLIKIPKERQKEGSHGLDEQS